MTKQHFVILGGGISGLSLAWYLKKKYQDAIQLTIIEKSPRVGGWIRSMQHQGFLFEEGPRSCRTKGAGIATLQLIEELGLTEEVIVASSEAHRRYLYTNKQLQCLPQGVFSALFSPLTRNAIPTIIREWFKTPQVCEDESIHDFFVRRFSLGIAEQFIDPMVSGIYAGDIKKLSMRACFPQMHCLESEYGSLIKGMLFGKSAVKEEYSPFVQKMKKSLIFSFKQGMQTLVDALGIRLKNHLRLNTYATHLKVFSDYIEISLSDGQQLQAQQVFLALPAEALISLSKSSFPNIVKYLPEVQTASVAVVNLGWTKKVLKQSGFGYLIPSKEQEKILGVVWDSSVFPLQNSSQDMTRLTVMLGGSHHPEMVELPYVVLQECAQHAIKEHLKIDALPDVVHIHVAKQAIPQYVVGHVPKLKQFENTLNEISSRLSLHGSAWHGVAVNDCILNAKRSVDFSLRSF